MDLKGQTVGKILKTYRINREYSQIAICKKIKMSRNKLIEIEKGEKLPTLDELIKLCAIYNIKDLSVFLPFLEEKVENFGQLSMFEK